MVRDVRRLVRERENIGGSSIYELYKMKGESWESVGRKYEGVRSIYNLMENNNFNLEVGYEVLSDIWNYLNEEKYGYSEKKVGKKMKVVAESIMDKGSIIFEEKVDKEDVAMTIVGFPIYNTRVNF